MADRSSIADADRRAVFAASFLTGLWVEFSSSENSTPVPEIIRRPPLPDATSSDRVAPDQIG